MYFIERPPAVLRFFFKGAVWRINKEEKAVYLTFDDGPTPVITTTVLDILDRYNVKATFFCVGSNVVKYPEIYAEVLRRGHTIGNHTYQHMKGFEQSVQSYVEDVEKAAQVIDSHLFRPPYGRIKPAQLKQLRQSYKVILWDLVTRDYNHKLSPEFILKQVRRLTRNGSVVVFHDSKKAQKNLLAVLPGAIEFWQAKGYRFNLF